MPGKKGSFHQEPIHSNKRRSSSTHAPRTKRAEPARNRASAKSSRRAATRWKANFDALFQSSPVPLGIITRRGTAAAANESFLRLLGLETDEVIGRDVRSLDIWANREELDRLVALVRSDRTVRNVETQWHTRAGRLVDILLSVEQIKLNGRPHLLGIFRDVTERKRVEAELRHSEEQARALIKYAPTAIYEIDFAGPRFVSVNDAMCEMSGYSREELMAKSPFDLLDDESKRRFADRIRRRMAGETPDESVVYRAFVRGGREVYAQLNVTFTFRDGRPGGAFVIAHDVTERRRAEMEREALLQREQAAHARASAAVQLRDRFISVASHELRTPLTSIKGYADLLARRGDQAHVDEEFLRMARTIDAQAARLEEMIDTLLDSSRIEGGQLSIERAPVNVAALIERVVADLRPRLRRHSLTFLSDEPGLTIEGDRARLEQVVHNLLDNAIKYSPAGGPVTVRAWSQDGTARVAVADEGIGIPSDDLPQLFTRFRRSHNAEAAHIGGLGVGLYVVREIVRQHHGEIEVESRENQGSTFTVILPLAPAAGR
ncbi:MAG: PAS domain S-box protein [Rudaea sp.]